MYHFLHFLFTLFPIFSPYFHFFVESKTPPRSPILKNSASRLHRKNLEKGNHAKARLDEKHALWYNAEKQTFKSRRKDMIVYVTKATAERYKVPLPEGLPSPVKEFVGQLIELERDDSLLEWGAKLFYFDRRKCLVVSNFASKFTLFLADIKMKDFPRINELIEGYLFDIYSDNAEMTRLLNCLFHDHPLMMFSKLQDKGRIAHLNYILGSFADDGDRLYEFIEDGILQTKKFNKICNCEYFVSRRVDGKKTYVHPAETFEELLKKRYSPHEV